jgi:trehalose synthase
MTATSVSGLTELPLATSSFDALNDELTAPARARLEGARVDAHSSLSGRTVWWINSTPRGGGVAEMLRTLVPYWRGEGIDARWLVLEAPPPFYRLTKRIHNLLHGVPAAAPGIRDTELFDEVARQAAAQAVSLVAPGELVVLEDPQTAGLVSALKDAGAVVVWRCHVGADEPSAAAASAWTFLLPRLAGADRYVFTRREFVPVDLETQRTLLLAPAIDPLSHKNRGLDPTVGQGVLAAAGLARAPHAPRRLPLRRCRVMRAAEPPVLGRDRLVVSLARWDRLKDPVGVMRGFVEHVDEPDVRLILAGPSPEAVADDPEAEQVLHDTVVAWERLPRVERRRVDLAVLPMVDLDENALIVNALQRQAAVIVKKSLQEGFGLGVTEGMWKARPVIATRVGGHQDQIEHRRSGLLVDDPGDLAAFGAAIAQLLGNPADALTMATAARERVRERFLADRHFVEWTAALRGALDQAGVS